MTLAIPWQWLVGLGSCTASMSMNHVAVSALNTSVRLQLIGEGTFASSQGGPATPNSWMNDRRMLQAAAAGCAAGEYDTTTHRCVDTAPPTPGCASQVLTVHHQNPVLIADLLPELDDNSFHYLLVANTTIVFADLNAQNITINAEQHLIGAMDVAFVVLPARLTRQVHVTVTDASANQASCDLHIYVRAPELTPSSPNINLTTLTTSSTQ
jgi:hypothetical protein